VYIEDVQVLILKVSMIYFHKLPYPSQLIFSTQHNADFNGKELKGIAHAFIVRLQCASPVLESLQPI
jgi:hypothetical protein